MSYCEFCGKEIDQNQIYGSGRFCNKKCQARKAFLNASRQANLNKKQRAAAKRKTVTCPACGKEFITVNGKFCSRYCSNHYTGNKSRVISEETKKKTSETLKNYYKNNEDARRRSSEAAYKAAETRYHRHYKKKEFIEKFCSCGKKLDSWNKTGFCQTCLRTTEDGRKVLSASSKLAISKVIAEGKHKGWITRNITSYAEKFWIKVLDNNNIQYQREFTARYGEKAGERYFLDFYIEKNSHKIDLEIDGKQHSYQERIDSDVLRDERLTNLGYKVYRIKWNEISSEDGKLLMKSKIDNFINWYHNL